MSKPIRLQDLVEIDGVIGAVRWQESLLGKAVAAPPRLVEYVGLQKEERARHIMLSVEAMGLSIKGVVEMEYTTDRRDYKTSIMPVDSFMVHGQNYSLMAGLNRVAVLFDSHSGVDLQDLSLKLNLVENG